MTHHCPDCLEQIPAGQAVIRSINLQRVALCQPCAEARGWTETERSRRWAS